MPQYWGKQIFRLGSFPKVGQKQKTQRERKKEKESEAVVKLKNIHTNISVGTHHETASTEVGLNRRQPLDWKLTLHLESCISTFFTKYGVLLHRTLFHHSFLTCSGRFVIMWKKFFFVMKWSWSLYFLALNLAGNGSVPHMIWNSNNQFSVSANENCRTNQPHREAGSG